MILTSENIDTVLYDNAYLLVARPGDDGNVHLGKIHPHETVSYSTTVTYSDTEILMEDLGLMPDNVAAIVHKYPNRQSAQYVVKMGEVL